MSLMVLGLFAALPEFAGIRFRGIRREALAAITPAGFAQTPHARVALSASCATG